jgi:DNA-binding XRE family transcriptional regulator
METQAGGAEMHAASGARLEARVPSHTRTQLNEIRERRGISAAQLAKLAAVSRQTIYAIEAGEYVPNTTLALQLARILEVSVEDLFRLETEPAGLPKPVTVELIGSGAGFGKGQPIQICRVDNRLVGVSTASQLAMLPLADGVIVHGPEPEEIRASSSMSSSTSSSIRSSPKLSGFAPLKNPGKKSVALKPQNTKTEKHMSGQTAGRTAEPRLTEANPTANPTAKVQVFPDEIDDRRLRPGHFSVGAASIALR